VPQNQVDIGAQDLELRFRQHNYWDLLEILRDYWPGGWKPKTILIGEAHLKAALAKGKGVILWTCNFTHTSLPFYKTLAGAGYPLSILMHGTHGFSDTRFGVRFLNPVRVAVESRYVKENCLIGEDGAGPAIRRLIRNLSNNECVYIASLQTGRHVSERPCLGGRIRLAKGGPSIALSTGAALIPAFAVAVGPSSFEIHLEPPLVSSAEDADQQQEDMVSAYVPILEQYIRKWPHLWRGWIGPASYWRPD
jgi:lauroyl/myristoyl acyltransferase